MSFDTDWDIDYYKTEYESDEHWELRRAFIEAHKEKFPENELVCLAQVFTNIEFLGCRYPAKTMERVAELSKEVAEKFRESRESRIKRTFVGASDAAGAKAKGRNSQSTKSTIGIRGTKIPSLQSTFRKAEQSEDSDDTKTQTTHTQIIKRKATDDEDDDDDDGALQRPSFSDSTANIQSPQMAFNHPTKRIPDTGLIIFETIGGPNVGNDISILHTSAAKQGATIKFETEANANGVVYVNGNVYGVAPINQQNKQKTKGEAYSNAMAYARKIHYTIKQKEIVDTVAVDCQDKNGGNASTDGKTDDAKDRISSDNKGFKMMKMLGWTGGALGTSGDGIKEPVSIEMKVDRSGLGLSSESSKLNYDHFYRYLTKYKTDETATYDLVFSKEFDKEERKTLHEIAKRLSLKSGSRNDPDGGRYLVVQKKISLLDLANDIYNNGLQSRYYQLIPPTEPHLRRTSATPANKPASNSAVAMNYQQNQNAQTKRKNRNKKKKKL